MSQAGIQTFNTAFPLDFSIKNQFQGEDLPILYIVNSIDKTTASQKLNIQISATTEEGYALKGLKFTPVTPPIIPTAGSSTAQLVPSNAPISSGPSQYNLAFAIRPGTLRSEVEEEFSIALYNSITKSLGTANSCIVNGPIPRKSDGALIWYVAFENDIGKAMKPISEWKKTADGKKMKDMIFLNEGGLLGVDNNDNIFTRSKIEGGAWTQEGLPNWLSTKKVISVAGNSYKNIVPLKDGAYSNLVVTLPKDSPKHGRAAEYASENGTWIFPPSFQGNTDFCLSLLPDDTFAVVGTDNNLYHYSPSYANIGGFLQIDETLQFTNIAAKPDGSIVGTTEDGYLHARSNMIPNGQQAAGKWEPLDTKTPLSCIAVDNQGAILAYDRKGNFYQEAKTKQLLEFELEGISAEAGTGSRSAQIEMLFGNVSVNNSTNFFSFKRSNNISIINHEGHSYAPLHFGLIGDSTLLNKEKYQNAFSIFFETIDGKPIALNQSANEHTKIHFDFPYSDGGKNLMPFGNSSEVKGYQLSDSEAYPFLASGPFNPIGGEAFDGSTNKAGSIRFTAEFKDLTAEQQAKYTSPQEAIDKSKQLFQGDLGTLTDETTISNAIQQCIQLAEFISASNGPMQYFMYANGMGTSTSLNQFYTIDKGILSGSSTSQLLPINLFPTSSNPDVPFDDANWKTLFNTKSTSSFTIPNTSNSVSSWDVLPDGFTPIYPSTDYSFSNHPDFLAFVKNNFNVLVQQLKVLNSSSVGVSLAPNEQNVEGILPCKAIYEFFKIQYELKKAIPPNSEAYQNALKTYLNAKCQTLANFITASDGPIESTLAIHNFWTVSQFLNCNSNCVKYYTLGGEFGTNYLIPVQNQSNTPTLYQIDWILWFQTPFVFLGGNKFDFNSLPPSFQTDHNYGNQQVDLNVIYYVSTNLKQIISSLKSLNSAAIGSMNYDNEQCDAIFPCATMYEFFKVQYQLDQMSDLWTALQPNSSSIQVMAKSKAMRSAWQAKQNIIQSTVTLIKFFNSSNGPIANFIKSQPFSQTSSYFKFMTNDNYGGSFQDSLTSNGPNSSQTTFSTTTWNDSLLSSQNGFSDMPEGMISDYGISDPWTQHPNLLNYCKENFEHLAHLYYTLYSSAYINSFVGKYCLNGTSVTLNGIPMPACEGVYAFFQLQYQLHTKAYETVPDYMIEVSNMINTSKFSISTWDETMEIAESTISNKSNLFSQSAIGKTTQNWSKDFQSYLTTVNPSSTNQSNYFISMCEQLDTCNLYGKKYLIPCQVLYDYLWSCYQSQDSNQTSETKAELYAPSSYAFNFGNVQVSGEDGWVTIGIRVENLPGYWDSSFQITVRKSKTIFAPTLALGRGGPNGRMAISPTDPYYINTQGFNPGSRIDFLSALENEQDQPNVSIEEHYGLNLYGTLPEAGQAEATSVPTNETKDELGNLSSDKKVGQPVKVREADLLIVDGRLGIGNVPQGDISGNFSNPDGSGSSNPNEKLRVEGDVTVNGTIGDQYGPLVPSGTIIQLFSTTATSYSNYTAPKGWLACNGTKVGETTPPKISAVKVKGGCIFHLLKQ